MINRRVVSCADRFWRLVGKPEPFPRALESSIAWALPLAIVKLPHLGIDAVRQWLEKNRIPSDISYSDRSLRALLVARAGKGIIFLDGTDPEDERRFSLAHEVAHFILDYLSPREAVLKYFGETIRDVLDGYRLPTTEERLKGVLRGIKIGSFSHLLDRSDEDAIDCVYVLLAEDNADLLALELLAPQSLVINWLSARGITWTDMAIKVVIYDILIKECGLPKRIAENYGSHIISKNTPVPSIIERLGL